ncbi:MAG: hypothetical protein IPH72_31355 [Sandaracinaceae bacterium]|jgi:hypothetical protein|nr:hypothetical protein [Sandaracinaceae bacterium]
MASFSAWKNSARRMKRAVGAGCAAMSPTPSGGVPYTQRGSSPSGLSAEALSA